MPYRLHIPKKILRYESVGFAAIIGLVWLNELLDVPSLLGEPPKRALDPRESLVDTVVVLLVWLLVSILTRRLLKKAVFLQSLVKVCPGCGRVHDGVDWAPTAAHAARVSHTPDLCPDCAARIKGDLKVVRDNLEKLRR